MLVGNLGGVEEGTQTEKCVLLYKYMTLHMPVSNLLRTEPLVSLDGQHHYTVM